MLEHPATNPAAPTLAADHQSTQQWLTEALVNSLETMAFVSPLPFDGPPAPPQAPLRVRLRFGDRGCFELVAGEAFGLMLAQNILADPQAPVGAAEARDALRELANIICGALLNRACGGGGNTPPMQVPVVDSFDAPGAFEGFLATSGAVALDADGHSVAVRVAWP